MAWVAPVSFPATFAPLGRMLFHTFTFWTFFAVVASLYAMLKHRGQNALLLVAGYVFYGWGKSVLPAGSLGYVYLPALAILVAATRVTAPVGARLAHRLPVATLKKIFAGVLILLSAKMLHTVFAG